MVFWREHALTAQCAPLPLRPPLHLGVPPGEDLKALLAETYSELAQAASALPWLAALLAAGEALPPKAWVSGVALCVAGASLSITQVRREPCLVRRIE